VNRVKLRNKRVLISGGSKGVGVYIAKAFSSAGAKVALLARSESKMHNVSSSFPHESLVCPADLSKPATLKKAVQRVAHAWGGIDVLVNNAVYYCEQDFLEVTQEEWDERVSVSLRGPYFLTQAVIPHMLAQGGGDVISIGAAVVQKPVAKGHLTEYAASKGGLTGFVRALRDAYEPKGIRFSLVNPGWIYKGEETERHAKQVHAEEVARTVLFLASLSPGHVIREITLETP
jgi:NAD(P)-dependent dehydrogenase (short-subunit alcohol dehydrogenase family)